MHCSRVKLQGWVSGEHSNNLPARVQTQQTMMNMHGRSHQSAQNYHNDEWNTQGHDHVCIPANPKDIQKPFISSAHCLNTAHKSLTDLVYACG